MPNQATFFIYALLILLFSAIVHEVSHGFSAKFQGDNTAEVAGRLTLNPLPHLDPFGSVILPLLLALPALFGAPVFIIGWAKPVPFNLNNLRNKKWGPALVAMAGPLSNISIAVIFGLLFRVFLGSTIFPPALMIFLAIIIWINLLLAVFNLLPIPPLDGSRLFGSLFGIPASFMQKIERFGFFILLYLFIYSFFFNARLLNNFFKLIFTLLSWLIGLDIELTT